MKKEGEQAQACDVGLWKYSRHPNYFFEWMVWNGLIVAAIPSWLALRSQETLAIWLLLGLGLLLASAVMYRTLVHLTGAIPSEYYSEQKRPGYKVVSTAHEPLLPGSQAPSSLSQIDFVFEALGSLFSKPESGLGFGFHFLALLLLERLELLGPPTPCDLRERTHAINASVRASIASRLDTQLRPLEPLGPYQRAQGLPPF